MCGIVGIVDVRGKREVDRVRLDRMNESQHHRGPDGGGLHIEAGVGLGHRRLAIIDVASGQQPLFNEDGSVVVVFNGEIYNFQELIPELTALGHTFRTRSDTEVIVHAWESWGEQCVQRFRGMFAFALWDRAKETLFLARDRLGVKPLYYCITGDGWVLFGSELKSLLSTGMVTRDIDPYAIEEYFALGYIPEPRTIFKSSLKLDAGHSLVVRRGNPVPTPRKYWDVKFTLDARSTVEDASEELLVRLRESVRLRMISEVPLGAFLSGGVDSSAVVAAMSLESEVPVTTCSIAFSDPEYDESAYALAVAKRYKTNHYTDLVESDDFGLLDRLVGVYDEPYADSSALPTYRVCELARQHVTVALSGDGGDENFGGYRRYRMHVNEEKIRSLLPLRARRALFGGLAHVYPKADWAPRIFRAKSTLESFLRDSVSAYFHSMSIIRDPLRNRLLSDGLRRDIGDYNAVEVFHRHAASAGTDDPLALVQYLDLKTYLIGDINTKVDRASMAHALEVREPLMDHRLVEWLATLPSSMKIQDGQGKWLFKRTMERHLPQDVLYRPKMGFAVPVSRWFRGPLAVRVREAVLSERMLETGFFSRDCLAEIVEQHQTGRRDHSAAIWALLMFDGFLGMAFGENRVGRTSPSRAASAASVQG